MKATIEKPEGTFYSDWQIKENKLYAYFEFADRKKQVFICHTDKEKIKDFKESDNHITIEL